MSKVLVAITALTLIGLTSPAVAQTEMSEADREQLEREMESVTEEMERARVEMERAREEMDFDREGYQKEMQAAQAEMEKAAREMARIGQEIAGQYVMGFGDMHRRARLGINLGEDTGQGLEIVGVTPGGPAEAAGVRAGDTLVAIDGQTLNQGDGTSPTMFLIDFMSDVEPDQQVSVSLLRDGQQSDVVITADENDFATFAFDFDFPELENFDPEQYEIGKFRYVIPDGGAGHGFAFGGHPVIAGWGALELVSLTPDLGRYFGTDEGLLVVRAPGNDTLQLRGGDVILKIGDRVPKSPGQALHILATYEDGDRVEIEIMREQRPVRLDVVFPEMSGEPIAAKMRALCAPQISTIRCHRT